MRDIKGRPWLFPGVTDVTDCNTARDVIAAANLDFTVAKCEVVAKMPAIGNNNFIGSDSSSFLYGGSKYKPIDNAFATYRTDTLTPLGQVKSKYEIVQNRDAFNFFDDAIGVDKAIWDTAGCFDGGKRIFISAKLPKETVVNGRDNIQNYLVFTNSHDGSTSVNIMFTSIRIICQNCLPGARKNANNNGAFINFRHTQSVHGNIATASEILGIAVHQAELMEIEYNNLALKKVNDLQVMDYFASIHLNAEEYNNVKQEPNGLRMLFAGDARTVNNAGISTRKVNMLRSTMDYYVWGPGQKEFAGTAWGAFNAVTGYYSNIANLDGEKRMDTLLYGRAGTILGKALELVA